MQKTISIFLMIALVAGVMLSSCGTDEDNDAEFSLNGTSWKVTEDWDSTMLDAVLTFMDNGDVKLSKAIDGWNNPKWIMSKGHTSNGSEIYDLTITMDDGSYLMGEFAIIGAYITKGSTTYNAKNYAQYSYSWYEKGQDIYGTLSIVHGITLQKQ